MHVWRAESEDIERELRGPMCVDGERAAIAAKADREREKRRAKRERQKQRKAAEAAASVDVAEEHDAAMAREAADEFDRLLAQLKEAAPEGDEGSGAPEAA